MPYSINTLQKAKEILSERRMNAIRRADYQRDQLYKACPRLSEIDLELSEIGSTAARTVLSGGDVAESLTDMSRRSLSLQDEYAHLLHDLGISADEIVPDYHCKKCSDTGYIEEDNRTRVCDCLMKLMSDVECESLNAASPLELSTFESFRLDYYSNRPDANGSVPFNRMSKIFNYCRNYADTFSKNSRSILMRGATGLGKTHLSLAIANEVIRRGCSVVYVSAPDILTKLEREHFSYHYNEEDAIMRSLTSCDLLIIDDLGTEFSGQYSVAAIYNIFNSRILAGKPIIMNTNLTMNELLTTYSQRFVSRVMGSCDKLDFIGEDVRPKL